MKEQKKDSTKLVLQNSVNHSLIDCLKELKYGRTKDDQEAIDEFIESRKALRSESMRTDATNDEDKAIQVPSDRKITLTEEESFKKYLAEVLNEHALDNYMNIPDYILADYLNGCLHELGKFKAMLKHHER